MKRIIIMACYSSTGEIEDCKIKLIESVSAYADYFIIVLNGFISQNAYSFVQEKASKVLKRENIGYDAGAYKDAIADLDLNEYDELLLMNDTFYGFFYFLDEFFDKTEKVREVDFWGLTKHPQGICGNNHYIREHIQAYFILIKSRMLHSEEFRFFWSSLDYPNSYNEAVENFEVRFTTFFQEKGFKGETYSNLESIGIESRFNENPYLTYPYELIEGLRCPVLKRKSCYIGNSSVWKAIAYIREKHLYDVGLIFKQMLSDYKTGSISSYFNLYEMEIFLQKYEKIYIFGKGMYGSNIYEYLAVRNINVEKFIVSNKESYDDGEVIALSELLNGSDFGIIVALKPQYTKEVIEKLLDKVSIEQLFLGKS